MWWRRSSNILVSAQNQQWLQHQDIVARWYRKPAWLPIAKTKVFRISERPQIPKADVEELKRLHNNYRTQMRAIRRFFHDESLQLQQSLAGSEKYLHEEQLDLDRRFAINDNWNQKIAAERETYQAHEKERRLQDITQKILEVDRKEKERIELAEIKIKKEIEESKTFITLENLDEAIENCLKTVVDYNYAIDLDGNYYKGRNTNPENIAAKIMDEE